jgi:hypothetical protein
MRFCLQSLYLDSASTHYMNTNNASFVILCNCLCGRDVGNKVLIPISYIFFFLGKANETSLLQLFSHMPACMVRIPYYHCLPFIYVPPATRHKL